MTGYNPKKYFDNGRTFPNETDLGEANMQVLRNGEIITIINKDGSLDRRILMDSFDQIRCSEIDNPCQPLVQLMFGVPVSPFAKEVKMKQQVWFHAFCNDGLAAAAVAYRVFGDDARYIAVEYGKEHPPYEEGDDIAIVDFSYPWHVLEGMKVNLIVLDHHKTAQADLEGRKWGENKSVLFDQSKSGAKMAWDYWFPNQATPRFVELIQDRDLWKFEFGDQTNQLHAGLELAERSPKLWAAWLDEDAVLRSLIRQGETVLILRNKQIDQLVEMIEWQEIAGYKVPAVNTSFHMSDIGNKLCQLYPDAPFSAIWFTQSDGSKKYSLRSLGFDVSEIARKFGGGGHKQAAGFIWNLGLAREVAARIWCEPETSNKVMDVDLAEAFANAMIQKKL